MAVRIAFSLTHQAVRLIYPAKGNFENPKELLCGHGPDGTCPCGFAGCCLDHLADIVHQSQP